MNSTSTHYRFTPATVLNGLVKLIPTNRIVGFLLLIVLILLSSYFAKGQITYNYESVVHNGTSFTSSGLTFNMTTTMRGQNIGSLGSGSPPSNGFMDSEYGIAQPSGANLGGLKTAGGQTFKLVSLDVWPSNDEGDVVLPYGQTITVKGYVGGTQVYSVNIVSATFNQTPVPSGGAWHRITLPGTEAATAIDEFRLSFTSGNYLAVDNFVWNQVTTTFAAGDIAFTGYSSDPAGDTFSIVTFKDILPGTRLGFTDGAWVDGSGFFKLNGSANGFSEYFFEWMASTTVTSGTEIIFYINGVTQAQVASTGTLVSGRRLSLTNAGDQIFVFQGFSAIDTSNADGLIVPNTITPTTIITGIHANIIAGTTSATNWDNSGATSTTSQSDLPNTLTNGTNAIWFYASGPTEIDNGKIKCGVTFTAANCNNVSNWDSDDVNATWGFPRVCGGGCTAPTVSINSQTNVSCNGGSNGAASVNVSGGTAPYTYDWSPGNPTGDGTSSVTGLTAGTWTCVVTESGGCSASASVTITQPTALTADSSKVNVACRGGATGQATFTPQGGTSPYTYLWSNGGTSQTVTGLIAGVYSCTIADANTCQIVKTVTIIQPASSVNATTAVQNVLCNGDSTGVATINVVGGTSPYTYDWNPGTPVGDGTSSISQLKAGAYTVTVTDANGCTLTRTVTVTQFSAININNLSQINESCPGYNDGSLQISVSGGAGTYTYDWSGTPTGDGTTNITNLAAGIYTVTVRDGFNCTVSRDYNITAPDPVNFTISTVDVSCNSLSDGEASVAASGGVTPYLFVWSTGSSADTITALAAGDYFLNLYDGNGCLSSDTFTITEPAVLSAAIASYANISCNGGGDGSASVNVTGGTTAYTYNWTGSPVGDGTNTVTSLVAGTYIVTVTDANSCTDTATVTISQPAALVANQASQTNVSCNNGSNGTVTVGVTGGTPGYSYNWNGTPTGDGTATITGLIANTYTVTVTDALGCTATATFTVTQPAAISISSSQTNITCNGESTGQASVFNVTGGTAPYTYLWSNGDTNSAITNIPAGTYFITITDANSCQYNSGFIITEPTAISTTTNQTPSSCYGGSTGIAEVSASGGVGLYSYLWSSGGTTSTEANLTAGMYYVTVTDGNLCSVVDSIEVQQQSQIQLTINHTDETAIGANDGTAEVLVTGGVPIYMYNWSNGGSSNVLTNLAPGLYTVSVVDDFGCGPVVASVEIESAYPRRPGSGYALHFDGVNDYVNIGRPAAYTGLTELTVEAWVKVDGYTGDFQAIFSPATDNFIHFQVNSGSGGDLVLYTDNGGIPFALPELPIGQWTHIAVAFQSGNSSLYTNGLLRDINGATYTSILAPTTDVNIGRGHGGGRPFNGLIDEVRVWDKALTESEIQEYLCNKTLINHPQFAHLLNYYRFDEGSGNTLYDVYNGSTGTITNGPAWELSGAALGDTSTYYFNTPATLTLDAANGNTITVDNYNGIAYGGHLFVVNEAPNTTTPPASTTGLETSGYFGTFFTDPVFGFTYGVNIDYTGNNNVNGQPFEPTTRIVIRDNNSDTTWAVEQSVLSPTLNTINAGDDRTREFSLAFAPLLAVNVSGKNISCNRGSDGAIYAEVTGGIAPFTIDWSEGTTNISADGFDTVSNLAAGPYFVIVTDALGDTVSASITLTEPDPLDGVPSQTDVSCFGGSNGTATVTVSGGTAPYTYAWLPGGGTDSTQTGLTAGSYTVDVTDANGCATQVPFLLTEPDSISTTGMHTDVSCFGGNDGTATVVATGGTAPYSYLWSPSGGTDSVATGLATGAYTVIVTDDNGCTASQSYFLNQPTAITTSASQTNVDCYGDSTGIASVTPSGGTPGYTYNWLPYGGTASSAGGLAAGTYTVEVTDTLGCTHNKIFIITQPDSISVVTSQTNVSCFGGSDGVATVHVSGGTLPYLYIWNPSAGNDSTETGLAAGAYTSFIFDGNGCQASATITITEPAELTAIPSQTNVSCFAGANGTATVSVSGGTTPYTYAWSTAISTDSVETGLSADSYTVSVTDANGCSLTQGFTITEPGELAATNTVSHILCRDSATGSIDVSVVGGTSPYSYLWSGGDTTEDISGVVAGSYSITVTDANGCTDEILNITISEPATSVAIALDSIVNNLCFGDAGGAIYTTNTGGTGTLSFSWSNSEVSEDITGLVAGPYTLTVTDNNGCSVQQAFTVAEPTALAITDTQVNVSCFGLSDGYAAVFVTGGTPGYTYTWSPNLSVDSVASNIPASVYTVDVVDANGCSISTTFLVDEPDKLTNTTTETDVTCNGRNDGKAAIQVSGGTLPYSYAWSPSGGNDSVATGLSPGTYTVSVTDANGCTLTETYTITEPTVLTSSRTWTDVLCYGDTTGTISVTVSGGTTPYNYFWSNGVSTEDLTGLPAGNYSLTVSDANGCISIIPATTINGPANPITIVTDSVVNNLCFGNTAGAVYITASGGTAPLTYLWSNSQSTDDIVNLPAGTYSLLLIDFNACSVEASYTITEPAKLVASLTTINNGCFGGNDGSIAASVTGGVLDYSYLWNTNDTTDAITDLTAGTYSVTVIDNNGCSTSASASVTEADEILLSTVVTDVNCAGGNTGAVNLTVNAGVTPYTYVWSNNSSNEDISNLIAGVYSVTVFDFNGCSASTSVTVTEPTALTATVNAVNVSCNGGSNGSVDLTVSGGSGGYTYTWSNNETSEDISGVAAGTYSVTVTDILGCVANSSVTVSEPAVLSATRVITNITCNGANNGAVDVTVTGGTPNYSFNWSNSASGEDISGLGVGIYNLTVTDANLCSVTLTAEVTQPDVLFASALPANVACNGGSTGGVNITVSGGTPNYTYLWSNSATTEDINGVTPGIYSVVVTDANGCTASASASVTEPAQLSASTIASNGTCAGNDGAIALTVTGGVPNYAYTWSNGSVTKDITGLIIGVYTVTIIDANGCSLVASDTVEQPSAYPVTVSADSVSCKNGSDGSVTATFTMSPAVASYGWTPGGAGQVTLGNIAAGVYVFSLTDTNGCVTSQSVQVGEPATAISASFAVTDVDCNGNANGAIDLTVSGGTPGYTYVWNGAFGTSEDLSGLSGDDYAVLITDANGCILTTSVTVGEPAVLTVNANVTDVSCFGDNTGGITLTVSGGTTAYDYEWSDNSTAADLLGVVAGGYSVTVTDANGCSASTSATVNEPVAALNISVNVTDANCLSSNDGGVDVTVTGGTQGYTYAWNNNTTNEDLQNIGAGTYDITVTDANGCIATASATVGITSTLAATASVTNVVCNDSTGVVDITVTGGVPNYSFVWSNGAATEDISGLQAGAYSVTISDAGGCSITLSNFVTTASSLALSASVTDVTCSGGNDGAIDLTATGSSTFVFAWSNSETTEDITGLTAGSYTVTVTDSAGCQATYDVVIAQPSAISATASVTHLDCHGDASGTINLTVTGGTGAYTFNWSNNTTTEDLNGLSGGNYTVTVTDVANCSTVYGPVTVTEPAQITISDSVVAVKCFGGSTGEIHITVTGGTGAYTYLWSSGATTEDLTNLSAGAYDITVTDANACVATRMQIQVGGPAAALSVALDSTLTNLCAGAQTGAIYITATGGTAPYNYLWSNGGTIDDITGLTAGNYLVTVTDVNGCSAILPGGITLTDPQVLALTRTITNVTCEGGLNGGVDVTVTNGLPAYTYVWSNAAITEDLTNVAAGNYSVTVTDRNGCSASVSAQVAFTNIKPSVDLGTDVIQCGSSVTLNAQNPGSLYNWNTGTTSQTLSVSTSGTYSVVVTDANGCSATDTIDVTINALPSVSFNFSDDVVCLNDAPITLSGVPSGGVFSGSGINGNNFEPATAGVGVKVVTYTVTGANNCTASAIDSISVEFCIGINDITANSNVLVYPNPSNGSFIVKMNNPAFDLFTGKLMNDLGQQLDVFELNSVNDYSYSFNGRDAGIYFVVCQHGTTTITQRVVVVK